MPGPLKENWNEFDWERELRKDDARVSTYMSELPRYIDLPDEDGVIMKQIQRRPELIPQGKGSYFPPTLPMTGWTSYVREADVVRRDGGYYLTKETVNPPLVNLKIEV